MLTEESMNSGRGVPHVRKTMSRTGDTGNHTTVDQLSIESGNAEPSNTGGMTTSHANVNASQVPSSLSTGTTNLTSSHPVTASLLQPPPQQQPSLRSSLYQNHHHYPGNSTATLDWYRFYDIRSMDIQSALDQMKTLLSVWNTNTYGNSKSQTMMIYKLAYYRKQTKNHWYRDDPTFILLQILMLFISCITYSIAFKISVLHAVSFIMTSILFNYLFLGVVITSILREFTNRHLLSHLHHHPASSSSNLSTTSTTATTTTSTHIQKQQVEWLYAFDIHCNSFFPLFIVLCMYLFHGVLVVGCE